MNIIRIFKDPSSTLMSTKCPLHDFGGAKTNLVQGRLLLLLLQLLGRILLPWLCVINEGSDKLEFFNLKKNVIFLSLCTANIGELTFWKKKHNYLQLLLYSLSHILSFSSTCWRWRASAWMVALKARRERGQAVCSWRGGPGSRRLNVLKFNFNF